MHPGIHVVTEGKRGCGFRHVKAITTMEFGEDPKTSPGIFSAYVPDEIHVIVDGTEPDEEIEKYLEKGFTPVKVVRDEKDQQSFV